MNLYGISEAVEELIEKIQAEALDIKDAKGKWPLSISALPYSAWVGEDFFMVKNSCLSSLNYYGGFEYVDKGCIQGIGNYTIFSDEDERVSEVVRALRDE